LVSKDWGLAFTVPGIMIGAVGLINFLFLVPSPEDVGLGPADGTRNSVSSVEVDPLLNSKFYKYI
jgi:sugar phosphate permease